VSTILKDMAGPNFLSQSEYNWVGAEECDDSDGEETDPLAIEGMVDEDGEKDPLALQDVDARCLDSTVNQWAKFLADVDNEDEEEFDLKSFKYCDGLSQGNVPEAALHTPEQLKT
jgi:hypothetical protein